MDDGTNGAQEPQFPALASQGSICNLNFYDVQTQLGNIGKPLNTMNYDELLKNVASVEEAKMGQNHNRSSSSSSPSASIFPRDNFLIKNNVDDVWKDTIQHNNQSVVPQGETTLEDFLARAGVINPPQPVMVNDPINAMISEQADWLQFQMGSVQQEHHHITMRDSNSRVSESIYGNPVGGYSENHQLAMTMPMPATSPDSQAEKKCRYSDEVKEKSIERRQRRMIKNRESAARSRARKQAYTNQLEHEVFHLRKTNSWLKKQKEAVMLLSSYPISVPKYQLRRTSSAPPL